HHWQSDPQRLCRIARRSSLPGLLASRGQLFHLRRIDQRAHRHASDPSVDRPRDGRGHRGKPAGGDRDLRRHRHARVGLPDRPLRQPVAALLLLRPARPFAAAPSLFIRQPPVRSHPVHRFLRPGLGCHCAAVRPGRRTWRWCGGSGLLLRLARRLAVVAIAIALALIPQVASAHAQLVQSDPAPDSVVDSAPTSITLVFTEPVTPAGAGIRVFDPSGSQVAGAVLARGSVLTAPIVSSRTGTYVVSWQVLAADTHPSRGAFRFVVERPSSNPYAFLLDVPE